MTASPWYYDYYEPGAFPHQQELCKAVEWTKCNLEGQLLVSPGHLTEIPANPLTIRLLALRETLNQLENSVNPINEEIERQARKQFDKGKMFGMGGTLIIQGNALKTGGAPVEIIRISGERKPVEFHYDMAHLALYEFFTNFGSVMDRLAYEINLLYEYEPQIKKVDWPKLADIRPGKHKNKNWEALRNKDIELAGFIRKCAPKFKKALDYRNRLVHDGIIRVMVDTGVSGLSIKLAQDPNSNTSPMNVDAISFCKQAKADVLKLSDESYKLMLQHHKSHGNLPW